MSRRQVGNRKGRYCMICDTWFDNKKELDTHSVECTKKYYELGKT